MLERKGGNIYTSGHVPLPGTHPPSTSGPHSSTLQGRAGAHDSAPTPFFLTSAHLTQESGFATVSPNFLLLQTSLRVSLRPGTSLPVLCPHSSAGALRAPARSVVQTWRQGTCGHRLWAVSASRGSWWRKRCRPTRLPVRPQHPQAAALPRSRLTLLPSRLVPGLQGLESLLCLLCGHLAAQHVICCPFLLITLGFVHVNGLL